MSPEEKEKDGEWTDGEDCLAPIIDDSSLIPPVQTDEELDKIWVSAGFKLPRAPRDE